MNPIDASSLWAKVLIPGVNVIPEWVQPDSNNGYSIGDKVTHNGFTWTSKLNNNAYEPSVWIMLHILCVDLILSK